MLKGRNGFWPGRQVVEFIVIVEGTADEQIARKLAERVILEKIDWVEPYLSHSVNWRGLLVETSCSYWRDVKRIFKQVESQGITIPRYRRGKGLKADGASAWKILFCVRELQKNRSIRAIILIRDLDNQSERKTGLEQAREQFAHLSHELQIIIGTADPKREAWVLNGFNSREAPEKASLDEIIQELGFDPCLEPERLRETSKRVPERTRNIKVVLETLIGGNFEREAACWRETDLSLLRERGDNSGLTAYLSEVEQRLVPIIERE
jgi:hypothetical protein